MKNVNLKISLIITKPNYIIKIFSKLTKLQRVRAYSLIFSHNCRLPHAMWKIGPHELEEQEKSLHTCIRIAQSQEYQSGIHALSNCQKIFEASSNSALKNHLTQLVIESEHLWLLHATSQLLLSSLRQTSWIVNRRDSTRCILQLCIVCKKKSKAETLQQLMGQFPHARVNSARSFLNFGKDCT
ncbi:hypothetical protein PR048_000925 [Dryococelus australis]|uniref:Uncharacterized protein n=1 Tax=Dryococelus australis TaxID=614101 RepID=A0ABQ9IG19_9NEOP|nr:hypothetical protein PR048_000925 [Dryococelus australis]